MRIKVLEILKLVRPDVDFERERGLFTNEVLDSFDMISIVAMISETFDIEFEPDEINENNFDTLDMIVNLISRKC